MKHIRSIPRGAGCLFLAAVVTLLQGCAPKGAWDGIYTVDTRGGAKACLAPSASPADGTAVVVQMAVGNDGGWCGVTVSRRGAAYDSYLLVTHPTHGKVFAHRVGGNTRIDYTPDAGFVGTDSFAVRLIPGDAVLQGAVNVTR